MVNAISGCRASAKKSVESRDPAPGRFPDDPTMDLPAARAAFPALVDATSLDTA